MLLSFGFRPFLLGDHLKSGLSWIMINWTFVFQGFVMRLEVGQDGRGAEGQVIKEQEVGRFEVALLDFWMTLVSLFGFVGCYGWYSGCFLIYNLCFPILIRDCFLVKTSAPLEFGTVRLFVSAAAWYGQPAIKFSDLDFELCSPSSACLDPAVSNWLNWGHLTWIYSYFSIRASNSSALKLLNPL